MWHVTWIQSSREKQLRLDYSGPILEDPIDWHSSASWDPPLKPTRSSQYYLFSVVWRGPWIGLPLCRETPVLFFCFFYRPKIYSAREVYCLGRDLVYPFPGGRGSRKGGGWVGVEAILFLALIDKDPCLNSKQMAKASQDFVQVTYKRCKRFLYMFLLRSRLGFLPCSNPSLSITCKNFIRYQKLKLLTNFFK